MLSQLRDYQKDALNDLNDWFLKYEGNPVIEAPTASGKSWIIAGFIYAAIKSYPDTRIIVLAPSRELVEQDREKILKVWSDAPIATYCAALHKKEKGQPIIIGTIQSMWKKYSLFGNISLIIIDEAHLVNTKNEGMYRFFIEKLKNLNPYLKVIGLTATPYRLGHGLITRQPSLFKAPVIRVKNIKWLQERGYLCSLLYKATDVKLDVKGVHKDNTGDYRQNELERAVDVPGLNEDVINAVISRAKDRHSWLFFCSGIAHAHHIAALLRQKGISCESVTSQTDSLKRKRILEDFKAGRIRALTNNSVLTTGFDAPCIDMIALLRPTMSAGLLMQMLGRGLRCDPSKKNTLILDFAGNIQAHGTAEDIIVPLGKDENKKERIAPLKICPECDAYVSLNAKTCPECGYSFSCEEKPEKTYQLYKVERDQGEMSIRGWKWMVVESKKGKIPMLLCVYYGWNTRQKPVQKYYCILHEGYTSEKAIKELSYVCFKSGIELGKYQSVWTLCQALNEKAKVPASISYVRKQKFYDITKIEWRTEDE